MSRPIEPIQFPLHSVEFAPPHGGILRRVAAALVGYWRNWRTRREIRALTEFSARELADIGLDRGDVTAALMTPLSRDAGSVLSVRAATNRAAAQARAREAFLRQKMPGLYC
ncbi:MAG: DUF1127 domain-containing protein [Hyphomicrobiales bacterium]|nr:DUF1127 domain-containing protein [Hyphomicrobiales bacterium]